ncbi:MAG: hydrogenase expression/formation protein HupK [Roseinatronobacter sp.]
MDGGQNSLASVWEVDLPTPPALGALLIGKPVAEVADTLPRLFNLCAAAQGMAARLSLGLPPIPHARTQLAREILRDHMLALNVTLPRLAGLPIRALPDGWHNATDLAPALWGGAPPDDLGAWLNSGLGLAPLVARVQALFARGEGEAPALPMVDAANVDAGPPVENSPAARHAGRPLMQQAEAMAGRGPLWRLLGRLCDTEAAARGTLPAPHLRACGMALMPAARGVYALRLTQEDGILQAIRRITPTDHMLAPQGALRLALNNLRNPALAPLLLALHDPCVPVTLRQVQHA